MKHNIVFKFVAVLLCAAFLMGAVGSAAGLITLAEGGLFNRSVEDMLAEMDYNNGFSYANNLALRYASINLGGCAEDLVQERYGRTSWFESTYRYDRYGYRLLDAEGNVLEELNPELKDSNSITYEYPVTGQYMHQITLISNSEKQAQNNKPLATDRVPGYDAVLYDAIPPEGTDFYYLNFGDRSGSTGIGSDDAMGFVYYGDEGRVCFRTYDPHYGILDTWPMAVYQLTLLDGSSNPIYEASSDSPLGVLNYDGQNRLIFTSNLTEETGQRNLTSFYEISFRDLDNAEIYWLRSDDNQSLGSYYYDEDGRFRFYINYSNLQSYSEAGTHPDSHTTIYGLQLYDWDGSCLYDTYTQDGLGFVFHEDSSLSTLMYRSNYPEIAAASEGAPAIASAAQEETVPMITAPAETVEETTVEETTETQAEDSTEPTAAEETTTETTAETTAETVPEETQTEAAAASADTADEDAAPAEDGETDEASDAAAATEAEESAEETVPPATETVEETVPPTVPEETVAVTEPKMINGKPLTDYGVDTETYWDNTLQETMYAEYIRLPMPAYTVELYFADNAHNLSAVYELLRFVHYYRNTLFPILGISLLLFVAVLVYLFCAAGKKPKSTEVRAGALNRIPLDLYFGGGAFAVTGLVVALVEGGEYLLRQDILTGCAFAVAMAYLSCLIIVGFLFAFAAQLKTPGGFWYRNTLCGWCCILCWRILLWLKNNTASKLLPIVVSFCKWCWNLVKNCCLFLWSLTVRFCKWFTDICNRFLRLLPVTWQWLLAGFVILFFICITFAGRYDLGMILSVLFGAAMVLYGSHCFGILLDTTKRMSKGDLDSKVDDKLMIGSFRDFSESLNDLAGVAVVAAQKQLKSERMKTELITNVSHDIKTPLTSIINYVDLLQKPHTDEEQAQYLEVLDRQSQQLKKLIEDLMDMSKASTGNMTVEITKVDAVESINQALGEFADKLDKVQLYPVFRHTEESVAMLADGRLTWRVLNNLLSNAVKYALPGTRLYIDLMELEGKVIISLKNISREELNIDADELMERFVRGDDSRNTEGSGLGLNIAKSLMELQKGQLQLLVDGDLFKVTLIFPGA